MDPRLERDPDAAFIITATVMIVAIMAVSAVPMLMEIPVIGVIVECYARHSDPVIGMPAVAVAIAGDASGSNAGGGDQGAGRDKRRDGCG